MKKFIVGSFEYNPEPPNVMAKVGISEAEYLAMVPPFITNHGNEECLDALLSGLESEEIGIGFVMALAAKGLQMAVEAEAMQKAITAEFERFRAIVDEAKKKPKIDPNRN